MEWYRSVTRETSSGGYSKIGITLGEEDIKRIIVQEFPGVPPWAIPLDVVFQLLELQAELYLVATGMIRFDYPDPVSGKATIDSLTSTKRNLLDNLKNSLATMVAEVKEQLQTEKTEAEEKDSGYI